MTKSKWITKDVEVKSNDRGDCWIREKAMGYLDKRLFDAVLNAEANLPMIYH